MTKLPAQLYRLALLAVLAAPLAAEGEIIRWRLTGAFEIPFSVGSLPDGISAGAPFVAFLAYESESPDEIPGDPHRGQYGKLAPIEGAFSIHAGATRIDAKSVAFWIGNDVDEPTGLIEVPDDAFRYLGSTFDANFDFSIGSIAFTWRDPTRGALDTDRLPTDLVAGSFQDPYIEISTFEFDSRVTQFTALANIYTITRIPEPDSLRSAFLGLLAALMAWGKPLSAVD